MTRTRLLENNCVSGNVSRDALRLSISVPTCYPVGNVRITQHNFSESSVVLITLRVVCMVTVEPRLPMNRRLKAINVQSIRNILANVCKLNRR